MRKQTKIAAVVSAAALLAIGASMTSFAATGWMEEDGTWVYYNKQGEKVTETWEKSGDNWFYLDDMGQMVTDALIEDDDDYYYVDANGAMVRNQWVAVDNEDAGEENEPDVWWYYFQANGKAYKNTHTGGKIFKKSINGKTYAFNDEGKMQYGWVDKEDGTTNYDDNAYTECEYYFGDENDGAMTTGWREIALTDVTDADTDQPGDSFWDEDQVRWFYFKSSGKKQTDKTGKTINGRKYGFDEDGRMIADWYTKASTSVATDTNVAQRNHAREFMYFSTPEDGARWTKGWFKVVPGYFLNTSDYDDGEENWYYADGNGKIYAGQIKSIKGKKYAFDVDGSMISGLAILKVESGNDIAEYVDDEFYDTEDEFDDYVSNMGADYAVYYFSDDEDHDGAMKTGNQKVKIDGDTFTFKFKKAGSDKGTGIKGEDDDKYYLSGKLLTADSDNKVEILNTKTLETMSVDKFVDKYCTVDTTPKGKAKKGDTSYSLKTEAQGKESSAKNPKFVVINTAGSLVKSGTKKDGDSFKVVIKNKEISQIYVD